MDNPPIAVVALRGVSLYTGHGQAPFELNRPVHLPAEHAQALIAAGVVRAHSEPEAAAEAAPAAETHPGAA